MGQQNQVGTVATSVFTEDGKTKVVYRETVVVCFYREEIELDSGENLTREVIELNSGGWKTVTTKRRINQASNQFDLGYQVYQEDGDWFVDYKGETLEFFDGIELTR